MRVVFCTLAITLLQILSQHLLLGQGLISGIPGNSAQPSSFTVSGAFPDYYQYLAYYYYLSALANGSIPSGSGPSFPAAIPPGGTIPVASLPSGTIPAAGLPIGTIPAAGLPSGTIPAAGLPSGTIPAVVPQPGAISGLPPSPIPTGSAGVPQRPFTSGLPPGMSGQLPTGVQNPGGSIMVNGTNVITGVPTGIQLADPTKFNGYPFVYGSPGLENSPFATLQGFFGPPCKVGNAVGHCINPESNNNLVAQLCMLLGNTINQGSCASGSSCCYSLNSGQPGIPPNSPSPSNPIPGPTIADTCTITNGNRGFCIEDTIRGHEYCGKLSFSESANSCSGGFFCCYGKPSNPGSDTIDMPSKNNVCGIKGTGMSMMGMGGSIYGTQSMPSSPPGYLPPSNLPPYSPPPAPYNPPSQVLYNPSFSSPVNYNPAPPANPPSLGYFASSPSSPSLVSSPSSGTVSGAIGSPWQNLRRRRRDSYSSSPNINPYNYGNPGATPAGEGEYCWQAAIYVNGKFKCSGSLIQKEWILTSAFCVFGQDPYNIRVRIGQANLNGDSSNSQTKSIEDIYVNPRYDPESPGYENNIALIHLKVPVVLDTVCLICLPGFPSSLLIEQKCTVTGYGSNALGQNVASFLRQVTQTIVSDQSCARTVGNAVRNFIYDRSYLCAGGASGADSCLADGGSPLVCQNDDGTYSQFGIASWSIGCGVNGIPTIYTDVFTFVDWIMATINLVEKEPAIPRKSDKISRVLKTSRQ